MKEAITIIIATYNGVSKIKYLLDALEMQTVREFELIVVVDGSTDNTIEVLNAYARRFQKMKIMTQPNSGRSITRNAGAREAAGDLLIFFDDDMKPYPDAVERYVNMYDGQEKLVAGNQIEFVEPGKTDIQNYKAVRAQGWVAKYTQPVMQLNVHNLFFTAATCSMTRSVFDKLGGFDERLTDAEDYNLARRALDKNIPVYFDRHNKSVHRDFITARSYVLRLREYQLAQERLLELYPQHKRFGPQPSALYKRLVYRLFASRFWIKKIDQHSLLFLPERLRYKLYDIIIQALAIEYPAVNV